MKKILCLLLALTMLFIFAGCNRSVIDVKYNFKEAVISLPNGEVVEGLVQSWRDWDDSDMIQVTLDDGFTYYTHSMNVCLIAD